MKERIAAFESARRAASYLGSAAAMAFAPSTPMPFMSKFRLFNGALKKPTEREMSEFLGLLASDEGTDCSIQKSEANCILPRKRPRGRSRTLCANLVAVQVQRFQEGTDQIKPNRNAEKAGSVSCIRWCERCAKAYQRGRNAAMIIAPPASILLELRSIDSTAASRTTAS